MPVEKEYVINLDSFFKQKDEPRFSLGNSSELIPRDAIRPAVFYMRDQLKFRFIDAQAQREEEATAGGTSLYTFRLSVWNPNRDSDTNIIDTRGKYEVVSIHNEPHCQGVIAEAWLYLWKKWLGFNSIMEEQLPPTKPWNATIDLKIRHVCNDNGTYFSEMSVMLTKPGTTIQPRLTNILSAEVNITGCWN